MPSNDQTIEELKAQIAAKKATAATWTTSETPSVKQQSWWSVNEAMTISSAVLVFGFVIVVVVGYLLGKGIASENLLRTFGTILIIIASVFLVVAGYSDQQIAPVMGLLGTIAGYLLGKSGSEKESP